MLKAVVATTIHASVFPGSAVILKYLATNFPSVCYGVLNDGDLSAAI